MNKTSCSIAAAALALIAPINTTIAAPAPAPTPALAAQWWQWAVSIPAGQNPELDRDGRYCMVGQRGSIWFLAGRFGGGIATRSCSVPQGTSLFFPIADAINFNVPNVCGQGPINLTVKEMRAQSKATIDGVDRLTLVIDGKNQKNLARRIQSPVFPVALPESNLFDAECSHFGGVPARVYSPAVDDGYYVLLEPLSPGHHTLSFQAEVGGSASLDVKYNLTVVPVLSK
jgi:hypothetical protein